jgi:fructose-bisphosphate aldolase class II
MGNPPRTATDLLADLGGRKALCAFNVESFDILRPAFRAAEGTGCPVILAYTVPAARQLGYHATVDLVGTVAGWYPTVDYALHLDHCQDPGQLRAAARAGFTSANFLNEGAFTAGDYLTTARALRDDLADHISLEFVLGCLGHIDDDHTGSGTPTAEDVIAFAEACAPDVLGFDCGSLHGMRARTQPIDIALIRDVAAATGLPIVLHGSSGVTSDQIRAGIDAGLRKINIETTIRATYMNCVRTTVTDGGPAASKPRLLTRAIDNALCGLYTGLITDYTLRKA